MRARNDRPPRPGTRAIAAAAGGRRPTRGLPDLAVWTPSAPRAYSQAPRGNERRELAQPVGPAAERRERTVGCLAQLPRELPRAVHAAERDERRLLHIAAHGLPGLRRIPLHVEQIVDD